MYAMKKRLLFGTLMLALLAACSTKTSQTLADDEVHTDSLTIEVDSMAVAVTLKVDGIAIDSLLRSSLAAFVGSQMFSMDDEGGNTQQPVYEGNLTDFLQACAQQKWNELKEQTFPLKPEDEEADTEIPTPEELLEGLEESTCLSSYLIEFQKVYETDSFVSWTSRYDFYVNSTAHPSQGGAGITIRKTDGKPLGHELLSNTGSPAFHQLMKESLRHCVETLMEETNLSDAVLKDYLRDASLSVDALPMPEQSPFLTSEGVVLPYKPYELLQSDPAFLVLPYNKVNPYLTTRK